MGLKTAQRVQHRTSNVPWWCSGGRKLPEGDVIRLKTARDSTIVAIFLPYKPDFLPAKQTTMSSYSMAASPFPENVRRPTILFSHGTAIDLGRVVSFYRYIPILFFPARRIGNSHTLSLSEFFSAALSACIVRMIRAGEI